jgi:hypothetical protein
VRASGHNGDIRRAHSYEPTREAAMAAFAKGGGSERRGQAGWRLDSERVEPFVDISGLFAAKCPQ